MKKADPRWRTVVLAVLAGCMLAMSAAPQDIPPLGFLGVAPLLLAVEGAMPRRRWVFLGGWIAGFTVNAGALYWVVSLLMDFARFPLAAAIPTASLLWLAQGLQYGFACTCAAALSKRGVPLWVVLPPMLAVFAAWTPFLFPLRVGYSQIDWSAYAQIAELGGETLLDIGVGYVGAGFAAAWTSRSRVALGVAAAMLLLPPLYGWVRLAQVRQARADAELVRVGVVQPNVGIVEKRDPLLRHTHLVQLQAMTAELERQGAELTIWPETAYPFPIPRDRPGDPPGRFAVRGGGAEGPLLFGVITYDRHDMSRRYNSALALTRDGRYVGVADKVELLAFGEYTPLWDHLPPLQERFSRGLTPGEAPRVLAIGGARIGVLNCYEDVLPEYAAQVSRRGPNMLVNVTNDAWFGDTSEPWLHQSLARLRSIETRRDLVRAVNTGTSSHITATGEMAHYTQTFEEAAFIAEVRLLDSWTPWIAFGDLVTPALAGALVGAAFALRRQRLPA